LEWLNEEGLVIISKFLHYLLFIIVCSGSSLPKIVCLLHFFIQTFIHTNVLINEICSFESSPVIGHSE